MDAAEIESIVRDTPTGSYARRPWFLYEWLTGQRLNLFDATRGDYVPVVNPQQQWAVPGENSARHRVRNNLPGTPSFCPLVWRTEALKEFVNLNLSERARAVVAAVPGDFLARTVSSGGKNADTKCVVPVCLRPPFETFGWRAAVFGAAPALRQR